MSIFEQLQSNKGTTSSALGKALADQVLKGDNEILSEAIRLVNYDSRNEKSKSIRAGAAKIIEKVAEVKPDLVSPYLAELFPALDVKEPQTRWMIITTIGYCAELDQEKAGKAVPYAEKFINEHQGICLSAAAEGYLGRFGEISSCNAAVVLPILLEAYDDPLPNEIDWILEAFYKIFSRLPPESKKILVECATEYSEFSKSSTRKRVEKILKLR